MSTNNNKIDTTRKLSVCHNVKSF